LGDNKSLPLNLTESKADTTSSQGAGPLDDPEVSRGVISTERSERRSFTRWQRLQITGAAWIGRLAIALIGRSLRWQVFGWEHYKTAEQAGKGIIFTFWHREIFSATWFWRNRAIVVMTSQNFDGEYIARIIQKHGYGAARGSSSKGASGALKEMIRAIRGGGDAAFTIDGPRGPRFVAKPGAVLLAKATGASVLCFHIVVEHTWVFRKSWDQTEIPVPFSRAAIFIAQPIGVSRDADAEEQATMLATVQGTLEELMRRGEGWRGQAGES
jgi:lysophospholipid acyltransferase (LPLAT)-like uncharacterized protein